MNGLNIHNVETVNVGQIVRCGENGETVFRRIIIETTSGDRFDVTVFGETTVNIEEPNNE